MKQMFAYIRNGDFITYAGAVDTDRTMPEDVIIKMFLSEVGTYWMNTTDLREFNDTPYTYVALQPSWSVIYHLNYDNYRKCFDQVIATLTNRSLPIRS